MPVGLLPSDGGFSSGLTALIDVLSAAQAPRPAADPSIPPIRPEVTRTSRTGTTGAGLTTAGAAFAHIDLALALVRRVSPGLAEHVARLLVIDERASQSAYLALDHLDHNDPLVLAFEQQARARLGEALDVRELAAAIGTSERTLERRTQAALGMSPLALVRRLRAERAVHLLRTTAQSVEQVAPQVGYAHAATLRALLRRVRTGPHVRPGLTEGFDWQGTDKAPAGCL